MFKPLLALSICVTCFFFYIKKKKATDLSILNIHIVFSQQIYFTFILQQ